MWNHQNLQLMLCTALSCVSSAAGLIRVFGYEGRHVSVSCPYDQGYERYQKYLCKNSCGYSDFLIKSSQENKTKYSVYDDKTTRVVTVTISDLHFDDAGKYWCGVTRAGKDIYTEIKLEVEADRCCDTVNQTQSTEEGSVIISCPYDSQSVDKLKFFCRGNRPSTCLQQAVITSSNTQDGRFRLSDDRKSGIFTVTISSLTLKDSGSYLCGVQRNSRFDVFTAVELEVKEKGEQNTSREKKLEDLPPSITTEVYWHRSITVKTIITTTPPSSEEQAKAPLSSAAGSIHVFGYEGVDVNVSCPYDRGVKGRQKYLCNNDCHYADVLITTSQGSSGKYSIHDDKTTRIFTVTISDLRLDDAGKYWCGVTRIGRDISIERKLEVKPDRCCDTVNKTQSTEEGSVTISCPYDSQSVNKLKFFCRGNRPSTCLQQAVITSSNTQDGRFRLSDDRKSGIFTVTISSLTLKDSGSYLCGVQRNSGFDDFSAVELEVKEWCCAKSKNMSGVMDHSVTFQCPYVPQHHNDTMFLCKGDRASNCTDMMDQSRFILSNVSSSSFSVTVTKLEAGDAGTYWCGSGPEANVGNFTRFHLSVDATLHQLSGPAFYALFALAAGLLLMVTLVLVKVYKNKCHKTLKERKVSR